MRFTTGVSNISKSIVLNTCDSYDWVQMAMGCVNPEPKILDVSDSVTKLSGVEECYVRLYETHGYGNAHQLRDVVNQENPDAILHITDPHRWKWLYDIEHEVRETMPLMYYHVWDNTPFPKFLKSVYESCDWIGCISKLTERCVNSVCPEHPSYEYIPHGVNVKTFYKQEDEVVKKNRIDFLGNDYDFVVFFNNANIQRKQLLLTIDSFSDFYKNKLTNEEQGSVVLLLHTNINQKSGSNVNTVLDDLYPDIPILISDTSVSDEMLNNMYNLSHVTINVASNEGFGLTTLESVASGTPIIISNTGGLADQFNPEWTELIEPSVRTLMGTQKTPYLYSDVCSTSDVSDGLYKMFNRRATIDMSNNIEFLSKRSFLDTQMTSKIGNAISSCIKNFEPRN